MRIEETLKEYAFQNVGQFRAIAKELGYSEEYNKGELRYEKGKEEKTIDNLQEISKKNLCQFFNKEEANNPDYIRNLLSEKNISVVRWEGLKEKDGAMKDAFTIIDHENKVCYTGRSFYDYAFERGYLLDGKGSQQEKGVMSDMREINGKQAKVRLTENGISVFYKKETLVIPDSILGRRLTEDNKNELLQGKIVLVGKEKDNIFLQVDRELNAVIVRTNKELAVPNVIGRGMDYSGRELTLADKALLANGYSLDNQLIQTKEGHFIMADVSLTEDMRGIQFANIQQLSKEEAFGLIAAQEKMDLSVAGQNVTEEKIQEEKVTEEKGTSLDPDTEKQREQEAKLQNAISKGDFAAIMELHAEGYKPSADSIQKQKIKRHWPM
ncbi:hypothetical protein [Tannerella forsythia]|uniref:DUF3945 domain-containing protein n=1 Tax=Tannerella forsythia TaxID=28112 RepID=A0A3P1YPA8_TANFO|nr:hypothetical protein [Tannerella forsythia]RRD72448.1 hypothetical protein EII41_11185 [Tannerella forsythia]